MAPSVPLSQITLPGHRAPAAGFEAPFEMLDACHERLERMLKLLAKLQQHLLLNGWDRDASKAALDVMRYFDQAAPLHHEDEERHVFPSILAGSDEPLRVLVLRLQQDHRDMAVAWARAREVLASLSEPPPGGWSGLSEAQSQTLSGFAGLYRQHLDDEDALIYPAAQAQLSDAERLTMSEDMMRRRGLVPP
jgi:hemerythrin-like domain-containing protein